MTPEEIQARFGKEALGMLYDCILQNTTYALADWILMYHTDEQIGAWIKQLRADMEDES